MRYTINNSSPVELSIGEENEVYRLIQGIALLLSTKAGTVPMYRDFGLPMNFVGKPQEVAETLLFQEVSDAFEEFVPNAELIDTRLSYSDDNYGKTTIEAEVEI